MAESLFESFGNYDIGGIRCAIPPYARRLKGML
jgi:hypothetical protein